MILFELSLVNLMFAPERIRLIKKVLLDEKSVDVSSLSSLLNVSEVTVRRDLEKLENENFLTRTHGGAILNDESEEDPALAEDTDDFSEQRRQIAEIAIHLVADNDVIALNSGIINLYIAKKLSVRHNLTVLTNDIQIATELSANSTNHVIMPGGYLNSGTMRLSGKFAEENIRKFHVAKTFVEVNGVSMARGYTVQSIEDASIIKEFLNIANQHIMVCTYDAFDHIAFFPVAPISVAAKVITNPAIPENYKTFFFENNIQLFTAFNSYSGSQS